jgi:hypothetical protein
MRFLRRMLGKLIGCIAILYVMFCMGAIFYWAGKEVVCAWFVKCR